MNLFNYLMNKNGKNLVDNEHMLEYLLNKSGTEKEVSGTEINITDVTKTKIIKLTLDKESSQDGTPTPENPIEVNTVKDNVEITITNGTNTRNYTIPLGNNEIAGIGDYKDELIVDSNGHCWLNKKINKLILTGQENWARIVVPDTNYRAFYITRPSNSLSRSPRISNYFKSGYYGSVDNSIWIDATNIVIGRVLVNNVYITEISDFKTLLQNLNTVEVYYVLDTPQLINLNYDINIRLFKGVNNITNSEDMTMTLKYYS